MLLTHALALSASQFVHKKKSPRIYTSMHSAGLELTKLTYIRLENNLIRYRGDRHYYIVPVPLHADVKNTTSTTRKHTKRGGKQRQENGSTQSHTRRAILKNAWGGVGWGGGWGATTSWKRHADNNISHLLRRTVLL